ncbi:MAG: copper-binding protein [Rhodospirillaceae bacterium]|jgi:Cu/Ag efflux protein CusF|nr:copper-binding protein [Rhodospirillaceae bacterium]MBT6137964.1 copper-binding protein [Rhodospirillaceae bacterium]
MHSLLRIMATLMVAAVAFAQPADAQTKMDHSKHKMGEGMHMATGTIVMVNKSKGMLVIDHDPIEGLMDAMTMGFKVANPDLLGKVKDGDKVEFMLRAKDMTVTDISKADSMKMKKMDGKKSDAGGNGKHSKHASMGSMHKHGAGSWMVSYRYMRMDMEDNLSGSDDITPEEIVTTVANHFAGTSGQPDLLRIVPEQMTMDMHMFGVMYGITDQLSVMAMGSYLKREMDHITFMGTSGTTRRGTFTTESSGIGDTKVIGQYKFGNGFTGKLGVSLPTGATDETDDILAPNGSTPTVRLPYSMQLGSGTFDLLPALDFATRKGNWGFGAGYSGILRLGENDDDYTLGNEHRVTGWASYNLNPEVSITAKLIAETVESISGIDPNIVGPVQTADPDNYGGERVQAALGLNFRGSGELSGMRIGFQVAMPLYQDLNGPQMKQSWVATAGLTFMF